MQAGVPYRMCIRGGAQNDSYMNDSVFAQFSGSVTSTGMPVNRIGTTESRADRPQGLLGLRARRPGVVGRRLRHERARAGDVLHGRHPKNPRAGAAPYRVGF